MPAIVEFPAVVQDALAELGDVFTNEPERVHFAEYLTGLMVADRKNVASINRQFARTTDQSCLNRWLTGAEWDVEALNDRRLDWLQRSRDTRYSSRGVIALDNVLVDHHGKLIDDAGWFWDHAEHRHKIAHDYLIANYGATGGKQYPLRFRRFVKRERCEEREREFRDHNTLFRELVDWIIERGIPGEFTFDSWFTHAANLNHIAGHGRGYVGDLKFNRKVRFKGQEMRVEQLAERIEPGDRKEITLEGKTQWCFTASLRVPKVDHRARVVVLWDRGDAEEPRKILITNRTRWEARRVLGVYRRRWRGTECFHRDGKQHLGMGDCQLRNPGAPGGADPPPAHGLPGVQRLDAADAPRPST